MTATSNPPSPPQAWPVSLNASAATNSTSGRRQITICAMRSPRRAGNDRSCSTQTKMTGKLILKCQVQHKSGVEVGLRLVVGAEMRELAAEIRRRSVGRLAAGMANLTFAGCAELRELAFCGWRRSMGIRRSFSNTPTDTARLSPLNDELAFWRICAELK